MSLKILKIVQNASITGKSLYLEIFLKSREFFDKKPYILQKSFNLLKMSSKSLLIFIKASNFLFKPPFLFFFKKPFDYYKSLIFFRKMS
jgi:hypothetical protein